MYQNILWEQKDRSAVITLNRPRVLNALSRALKAELSDALTRIKADPWHSRRHHENIRTG